MCEFDPIYTGHLSVWCYRDKNDPPSFLSSMHVGTIFPKKDGFWEVRLEIHSRNVARALLQVLRLETGYLELLDSSEGRPDIYDPKLACICIKDMEDWLVIPTSYPYVTYQFQTTYLVKCHIEFLNKKEIACQN